MNPNSKLTIFAMIGPMGSGKTTLALKIAQEQGALFLSLDGAIKDLNEPIIDLQGYERLMPKALSNMQAKATAALEQGQSVVFDVGRWNLLFDLANQFDTKIEIYCFEIPAEERWRRVQNRNQEKPENVYYFSMSKDEFDAQNPYRQLPPPMPGLRVTKITE